MKALVTGGAGFIGSHLVDKLIDRNIETDVLVSGFRSTKHPDIVNAEANRVKGNLTKYASLETATKDIDFVFHLGGIFSHYCVKNPNQAIQVNIEGTWNLKKACITNNVKRIIFASSSFVYGIPELTPIPESHPLRPKAILGVTKVAAEKLLEASYPCQIDHTILRIFNVYGPRQYPDELYTSVISTWMRKALHGKPLPIHDDGTQSLDFVYVEDVAEAFCSCIHTQAENQTFNVGSGKSVALYPLAKLVNNITGNNAGTFYVPEHPAFLRFVVADISKIKSVLGWYPLVDLREGLEQTARFYKEAE